MTIEYNDIYKIEKLSLFCKVIVFRTNDYDFSTFAFKCIIKTEPFFLAVLNEAVPSAKRTHRSSRTCILSPLFFLFFTHNHDLYIAHFYYDGFNPDWDTIRTWKQYILLQSSACAFTVLWISTRHTIDTILLLSYRSVGCLYLHSRLKHSNTLDHLVLFRLDSLTT